MKKEKSNFIDFRYQILCGFLFWSPFFGSQDLAFFEHNSRGIKLKVCAKLLRFCNKWTKSSKAVATKLSFAEFGQI